MNKDQIVRILEEIADLLELKGENPFKIRAYRNAARSLLNMEKDIKDVVTDQTLTSYQGIGPSLADKISSLVLKGRLPYYEKLKRSIPPSLMELLQVQGLGPKKVQVLYQKLRIRSIAALKKAAAQGKIAKLKGFGEKTQKNILEALERRKTNLSRHLWWDAMGIAEPILQKLKKLKCVKKAEIAGSVRRKLETVGDLDFLVGSHDPKSVMKWFTSQPFVAKVLGQGETKASIVSKDGMQMDLRVVPVKQFAFALFYFTGSKEHNIKFREKSIQRGWSMSEYGLETVKKGAPLPFSASKMPATEEEIYQIFGLPYIPPEIRENMGEIEAAAAGKLPRLIEEKDIRGSFHNHTSATDGRNTLHEMIAAAEKLGWEYIGISDHSKSEFEASGLHEEQLLAQIEEIHRLNALKTYRPYIFTGLECNILADGSLDFSDQILKKLDYVIVSVHSSLQQDEKTMTRRLIRAIEHPLTTMVGHVTGRQLLQRDPYAVNLSKVIDACIANRKIIELNGNPKRLDMDWRYWHAASRKGLLCCINCDAHAVSQLDFIRSGVNIARKGWLEKKHVINTKPLKEMQKFIARMRN
ncbi:MAG: polX [Parachlamydiales bacterium]|nr:polX [Parachlamydiales bacterium]